MPITELHKEVSNQLRQLYPVNASEPALSLQVERLNLRNLPRVSAGFLERCQAAPDSQCALHSRKTVHAGCGLLAPLRADRVLRVRNPLEGKACEPFRTFGSNSPNLVKRAEGIPQNELLQELSTMLMETNHDLVGPHNDWKKASVSR